MPSVFPPHDPGCREEMAVQIEQFKKEGTKRELSSSSWETDERGKADFAVWEVVLSKTRQGDAGRSSPWQWFSPCGVTAAHHPLTECQGLTPVL